MNKKTIAVIAALAVLILIVILAAASCQKEDIPANETTEATQTVESTVPVTTGPGVAYNTFGEPEFDTTEAAEETKAEENKNEETTASEETNAEETTAPTTAGTEEESQPTAKPLTDYEKYLNMSGDEQTAFIESFESVEAFFAWLNNAKAEYEAENPGIPIGSGTIDLGEIAG